MTPSDVAWLARWRAVRPSAEYHAQFGIEGAWRQNFDDWGYPLEDVEQDVDHDSRTLKGRTFSRVGLVLWNPSNGPEVVGWPANS